MATIYVRGRKTGMDPLALYGAVLGTLSLAVSGANFLRDRARLRFYPWLGGENGGFPSAEFEKYRVWLRIVSNGRRPVALRRVHLSFRCKRRFLFGPAHPPEWLDPAHPPEPKLSSGKSTEVFQEFSPLKQLEPLNELLVDLSLTPGTLSGHDFIDDIWAEDLAGKQYRIDRFSLWLLRRDIYREWKRRRASAN